MKKIIIASMALAFAPVFAQPAGYSFLATFEKTALMCI